MNDAASPDKAARPSAGTRRMVQGFWLSVAAWAIFFLGLIGALTDMTIGLSATLAISSYFLCVVGAAIFAVSAVMRSPKTPSFLKDVQDPFEDG